METVIAYTRVSTERQGRSGLGLEAQRAAIVAFAAANGFEVKEWLEDVESGASNSRPGLATALGHARLLACPIVIAKLDRLSRDIAFITDLMRQRVEFICCDLGRQDDPFILHVFAALAEKERKMIAARVKASMAAGKAAGRVWGNPRWRTAGNPRGTAAGAAKARAIRSERLRDAAARTALLASLLPR